MNLGNKCHLIASHILGAPNFCFAKETWKDPAMLRRHGVCVYMSVSEILCRDWLEAHSEGQ